MTPHPRTSQDAEPADRADRPAPPRPGPARAQAATAPDQALVDHTAALEHIQALPLQERAAALRAVHDDLAAALRHAQQGPGLPGEPAGRDESAEPGEPGQWDHPDDRGTRG